MKNKYGFTLVEVMVTVAILSLGSLTVHQGLLRSANILIHYNCELAAIEWAEDKLWEAKDALLFSAEKIDPDSSGSFERAGRIFDWSLTADPVPGTDKLYLIRLSINWLEGNKPVNVVKACYATTNKPPLV